MRNVIEQLRALNDLDLRLQSVQRDLDSLPKALAEKEEQAKLLGDQLARKKMDIQRLKIDADAQDVELKAGLDTLKRLANQMNVMRTSKEFDVVRRQMDAQRVWNSQIEDKALALMGQADEKQKEAEKIGAQVVDQEKQVSEEKTRVDKELAELRQQYDGLKAQRDLLAKDVPRKELTIYNRIVINRGQAIASVNALSYCTACHMKLPPQVHNLALLAQEMVTCPSCGRILTAVRASAKPEEEPAT
jgi:predicted  nucleic acid-binding Zn-ribbon protein